MGSVNLPATYSFHSHIQLVGTTLESMPVQINLYMMFALLQDSTHPKRAIIKVYGGRGQDLLLLLFGDFFSSKWA